MAGHRAPGRPSGGGKGPHGREAAPGAVGERHEILQCPVQMPADGAVQVDGDGDEWEQKGLRGCSATRLEAADFGHTLPVHAKGACEDSRFRGSSVSPNRSSFRATGLCRPAFWAGFAFQGFGVAASRKWSRARSGFRAQRERDAIIFRPQLARLRSSGAVTFRVCRRRSNFCASGICSCLPAEILGRS